MGSILRCFTGGDNHNHGADHYPHYHPTSGPSIVLQAGWGSPPRFQPDDHHQLGPHGHGGVASLVQDLLNFESTSMVTYALLSFPFRPLFPCLPSFCHFHLFSYHNSRSKSLTTIFLEEIKVLNSCTRKTHIYSLKAHQLLKI